MAQECLCQAPVPSCHDVHAPSDWEGSLSHPRFCAFSFSGAPYGRCNTILYQFSSNLRSDTQRVCSTLTLVLFLLTHVATTPSTVNFGRRFQFPNSVVILPPPTNMNLSWLTFGLLNLLFHLCVVCYLQLFSVVLLVLNRRRCECSLSLYIYIYLSLSSFSIFWLEKYVYIYRYTLSTFRISAKLNRTCT